MSFMQPPIVHLLSICANYFFSMVAILKYDPIKYVKVKMATGAHNLIMLTIFDLVELYFRYTDDNHTYLTEM